MSIKEAATGETAVPPAPGTADRSYWIDKLTVMARPVLAALAAGTLKATMPIAGSGDARFVGGRERFSHLEALARTLVGLAPWLETGGGAPEEVALRAEFAALSRRAIAAAVDPASPDAMNFSFSFQPIVDSAFLCHAILRAPGELWEKLPEVTKAQLVAALQATRSRKPLFNNWLLFSAMIEAGLRHFGAEWDRMRVDYALRQSEQWYLGDAMYADGPEYHADYYNSLVMQPFLVDIVRAVGDECEEWAAMRPAILKRAVRYGAVLERTISPEGTFPPLGRSLAYRCGAMQHLAQMALQGTLPASVSPAQVRCALTAVIHRSLDPPGTFDAAGWLTVGFAGCQPEIGEQYISTGSLYLATAAFLPLGLPPEHAFWSDPPQDWTGRRMWGGGAAPQDHALDHVAS